MPYEWPVIETLWLGESRVAIPPPQLIDGFNAAEVHLGADWVERHRVRTGVLATLPVATTGIKLRAVENAAGFADLVAGLRVGNRATFSELSAA
jgi:hypothetical protein